MNYTFNDVPTALNIMQEQLTMLTESISNNTPHDDILNSDQMRVLFGTDNDPLPLPTWRKWCREAKENGLPVHRQGKKLYGIRSELISWIASKPRK